MTRATFLSRPKRSRVLALLAFILALAFIYFVLLPGTRITDGRHDLQHNAIWLSHAYLGDAAWFERNHKSDQLAPHHESAALAQTAALFRTHHITDLFPHLCPASNDGSLPGIDDAQAERFLDAFSSPDFRVLPWVGGPSVSTARIDSPAWRKTFVHACAALLAAHPRFAGVHVNIEPLPSGNADFLALLDELRAAFPAGKIISVAAYPPPTIFHRFPDVHWDESYYRQVAPRCDQLAVMLYDTGLHDRRLYQNLLRSWTREVLEWSGPTPVLLGVPVYEDAGVDYHDPAVENIENALPGLHAGLAGSAKPPANYQGIAVYSAWVMNDEKWAQLRRGFLK